MEQLLELHTMGRAGVVHHILDELWWKYCGCRAGAKLKAKWWRYKPTVPSVLMGNVNSLTNKIKELAALVRNQCAYREYSHMSHRDMAEQQHDRC